MKTRKLIIVGTGTLGELAYEYFTHDSEYEAVAFSAEETYMDKKELFGLPVIPFERLERQLAPKAHSAFVAVGYSQLNRQRTRLYKLAKAKGYSIASYISSRAFVWRNVEIGENCFIFEDNTIQPFVKIGNNVILWSGNHIGHHSVVHDNCFFSSHIVMTGFGEIGENCFLGVNSTIINKVANDCFIGAGVLIQKDTEKGKVYQSVSTAPAKIDSLRLFRMKNEAAG